MRDPSAGLAAFNANSFPLDPGLRLLEASAGTGKTFALAHLVLRLVAEAELSLAQVLVVTFTDAAAAELRDRIGQRLQQALACLQEPSLDPPDPVLATWLKPLMAQTKPLQARLLLALEELDSADITTIHGFCRRTLQRQALEAGLPPALQLESDSGPLVRQIAHDYWHQQVLPLPDHLFEGLRSRLKGPESLEPLLLQLDGDPALQLDPLPADLDGGAPLAPQLEAFWSVCWQQFRDRWSSQGQALEGNLRSAAAEWRALGAKTTTPYSPKPTKDRVGLLEGWIQAMGEAGHYGATSAQELLTTYFHPGAFLKVARPIEAPAKGEPSLPNPELMQAIAALVEGPTERLLLHACHWGRAQIKQRRQRSARLGFAQLLEGLDPGEASSTALLAAVGERYGAALIDEFQDTDPIQWRILSRAFTPTQHRLVMVGDPKQAIYRFRGGELATYLQARSCAAADGGISGLRDNYRSAPGLIQALNRLMAPGLRRSKLAVPPVEAKATKGTLNLDADEHPLKLLWLGGSRPAGTKAPSRSALEQALPEQIAAYCAQLLGRGLVLEQGEQSHRLTAGDLCLLVSTHGQAEALRQALEHWGIASRLVSKGDVLESPGAEALQRFLDALADPANPNRLRLLAASPLLGWSPEQLVQTSPEGWSELAGRVGLLAEQLPRRGLLGVLGSLLQTRGLAELSLGGRLLADLQQSAELVQECLHTDHLSPAAAADWLRRRRLDPDRLVPEAHQPHSDVVDAAVSVVTVHRSKGLEYPVVICPYLWQAPSGQGPGAQRLGVRWHPSWHRDGEPGLDLHLNRHWGIGYQAHHHQLQADLEERERLAYVAATRAMHLLVLAWGPAHDQEGNPLHPWLFSEEPLPTVGPGAPDGSYHQRSDAEWHLLLEGEIAGRGLPIELLEPTTTTPGKPLPSSNLERKPLSSGPVPRRSFDTIWGRSSYTSWTHGSHGAAPEALEEGRETDGQSLETDLAATTLEATNLELPNPEPWSEQGPLATFPRGANAGDCLHRILEQLDYQQPARTPANLALVERELQRSGIATTNTDAVILGIEQLLATPFGGPLGSFQLNHLAVDARLNELNFDLTIGRVTAQDLKAAFADHPGGSFGTSYANSLGQLAVMSEGFLTGSIDLVFRAPGLDGQVRWWVADWKSNWLGERDNQGQPLACGPRHYGPAAMVELMAANHYPLQAHLYLVALHRYLGWRLPHYKPEQDLGGYAYVFMRGAPGSGDASHSLANSGGVVPGMFLESAPLERVLALDRALTRPSEARAA